MNRNPSLSRLRRNTLLQTAFIFVACTLPLIGCNDRPKMAAYREKHTKLSADENFNKGVELLGRMHEFEPDQLISQVAYHLNRWLSTQKSNNQWIRDPMSSDAELGYLLRLPGLADLDRKDINTDDVRYLQETKWLHDIGQWAQKCKPSSELEQWLAELPKSMSESDAKKLNDAARLFDWVIRNIQLQPLPPPERPSIAVKTPPAARAVQGPGYTRQPWQNLLTGMGDSWNRARVCLLLMRQANLDAYVLATRRGMQNELQPWAVAVLVNDQLYLFDPELGLAIPGPGATGIATLSQVLDDPSVLTQLDASAEQPYPVTAQNLTNIAAWIEAGTASLSERMQIIERRLTGEQRMVLSVAPSEMKRKLSGIKGITSTSLWKLPLEAELYAAVRSEKRKRDKLEDEIWQVEMLFFLTLTPQLQGRQLYFQHEFDSTHEKTGAAMQYLMGRTSEIDIQRMAQDPEYQKRMNLARGLGETEETWRTRILAMQRSAQIGNQYVSYWLGLLHYENGDYESAINWFLNRNLSESSQTAFANGARYNLGRTYEALGKFAEARQQYLEDTSPQKHGNLIRARLLEKRVGAGG